MQLPVLTFSTMLEQMAASVQGAASQLLDLAIGSVLRSLLEACAAVALWLQWLILQVLASTRAATSQGGDLDSWMADFSFSRLAGSQASGVVTFARYTSGVAATIMAGTTVLTTDGTQSFTVTIDASNPAWNGSAYILPASLISIEVPVEAAATGVSGNVLAGMIGLIAAPISGVDIVSNAAPTTGGLSPETDVAFRSRFQLYINSLSLATVNAIKTATASVQQITRYVVLENQDFQGNAHPGIFCVFADDGSGLPASTLLNEVETAVCAVRPIGSSFSVMGPLVVEANVMVAIETSNPATHLTIAANVQIAIGAWITTLPIGGVLAVSKIDAIAHATDPSVLSVTSTLINGAQSDLSAPINGVILAQTVTVS